MRTKCLTILLNVRYVVAYLGVPRLELLFISDIFRHLKGI